MTVICDSCGLLRGSAGHGACRCVSDECDQLKTRLAEALAVCEAMWTALHAIEWRERGSSHVQGYVRDAKEQYDSLKQKVEDTNDAT